MGRHIYTTSIGNWLVDLLTSAYISGREWVARGR